MDIILKPLTKNAIVLKRIKSRRDLSQSDKVDGYLIDADEKEIRRILDVLKNFKDYEKKIIAVLGRDDSFNRRMLEKTKIDYLASPERGHERDSLKQRDSGLNHVLARIAKEKGIGIIIDFSSLNKLKGKAKAERLARIMQNIVICRKAKCKIRIATFAEKKDELRDERDIKSIGFSWGMSSQQVKNIWVF